MTVTMLLIQTLNQEFFSIYLRMGECLMPIPCVKAPCVNHIGLVLSIYTGYGKIIQ